MAEIISRNKKGKKIIPRVDLTPMVDLGFLLITFFIITTSMTKPVAMNTFLPADGEGSKWGESKTLHLVLLSNNKVAFYNGVDSTKLNYCSYENVNGLRDVVMYKQHQVQQKFGAKESALVIIKPTQKSTYKNVVDVLDEMKINAIKTYSIQSASAFEENIKLNL